MNDTALGVKRVGSDHSQLVEARQSDGGGSANANSLDGQDVTLELNPNLAMLGIGAGIAFAVVLVASSMPARRAACVQPMVALR